MIREIIRILNRFDRTAEPMTLFMKDYFKGNKVRGVEIGIDAGKHTLSLLPNLNISELYLIDPYLPYEDYRKGEMVVINEQVQAVRKRLAKKRLSKFKNISFVYEDSTKCFDKFVDNSLDFVYIDGNHSREYVEADLRCYYDKVRKGGIIGGHDFSGTYIDVVREVLKFEKQTKLPLYSKGIEWWFIKEW